MRAALLVIQKRNAPDSVFTERLQGLLRTNFETCVRIWRIMLELLTYLPRILAHYSLGLLIVSYI